MRIPALLLLAFYISTIRAVSVDLCLDNTLGYITSLAHECPSGSTPFRHAGVNLYDVFWDAWAPNVDAGNMSTSLHAILDAGAMGFTVARAFAAPWSYKDWGWLDPARRAAYWAAADEIVEEVDRMGLKLIPSLGYGCADSTQSCNPALVNGETYREFITNSSSRTRVMIRTYAQEFVGRYKNSSAILLWELGNELNLAWDGCSYDKSVGSYFTTAEGIAFLDSYAADVKAIDPVRPVNTGLSSPRLKARHLMETPGGGHSCVTPQNPNGDCELCPAIAADTLEDTLAMITLYYKNMDMVSSHFYGCLPPFGNYSWCPQGPEANISTLPLHHFKAAADAMSKPFYLGEYGPASLTWGTAVDAGPAYVLSIALYDIRLSTMWAFECPSHSDAACIHPGSPARQPASTHIIDLLNGVDGVLNGHLPRSLAMTKHMLPPPRAGRNSDPACLDGTPYGYYVQLGARRDKWVVLLEGGGWCPDLYQCWQRTLDEQLNGTLGSSRNWGAQNWNSDLGAGFADWSYVYLPYCDGASYSSFIDSPIFIGDLPPDSGSTERPPANFSLYFRGAVNLESGLRDVLQRYNSGGQVTEVVLTGGSAGGLSTTLHVDRVRDVMQAEHIAGLPQCGYFPYYNDTCHGTAHSVWCNATDQFEFLFKMHNCSGAMPPACVAANPGSEWRCFMAPTVTPYVKAPLFIWQSKFDQAQLSIFVDVDCIWKQTYSPPWVQKIICNASDTKLIENFGEFFMKSFDEIIQAPGSFRGVFLTSCILHGMDYNYLSVEETSPNAAFNVWYRAIMHPADPPIVENGFKWVENMGLPRTDNSRACPPFQFTP